MIVFITAERLAPAIQGFFSTWGRRFSVHVRLDTYERLFSLRSVELPRATYIFTALGPGGLGERFPPSPMRQRAIELHALLVDRLGQRRVLNHPGASFSRLQLLSALHARGLNAFSAARAGHGGLRYPIFLRGEHGALWNQPPLLASDVEYRDALAATGDTTSLLAVEFLDTSDASGIYRKYGAFIVGERIVPRHLFFSRQWLVKAADLAEPWMLEEELAYVRSNPHADALREVCRMANLSYGRVDYALLAGRPQVWEINNTPQIANTPGADAPGRDAVHLQFSQLFEQALDALDRD